MNLYYLQPNGHGPTSYFVMASSPEDAAKAINQERARVAAEVNGGYFQDHWGGDGAVSPRQLSVAAAGQVLSSDND